jgi:hypothetical protein
MGIENTENAYKQFGVYCEEQKLTKFLVKPATVTFVKKLVEKNLAIATIGVALAVLDDLDDGRISPGERSCQPGCRRRVVRAH